MHYFTRKLSLCHLSLFEWLWCLKKKEEVYNILIIKILYINIYFFCFQFLEKWQVTSDNLPITTFNALIFSNLRTQNCHFFSNCHFLTVTKSVQIGRFWASIVKFGGGVTFAKSDTSPNLNDWRPKSPYLYTFGYSQKVTIRGKVTQKSDKFACVKFWESAR